MFKSTRNKLFIIALGLLSGANSSYAREGMWIPSTLESQEQMLKDEGLVLPVSQLYNDSAGALNHAVALFGNGCTASFISGQGLLLTNHHCGYSYAQKLSTPEHNFLTDGFWAMNRGQELPCPGLTITITRKIENVTEYVLKDITESISESKREELIAARMKEMAKAYEYLDKMDAKVVPFFGGNQYWVVVTQTFKDVRLVAFPPNGIGKFGADRDNWMWPRVTGDFSLFRVYANSQNQPAEYSPHNVPYNPDAFLPVATSGYQQGTFAMVYGYPYLTEEYLTSFELGRVRDVMYPVRVSLREKKLAIWDSAMRANPDVFLKYAAKQASESNGYKKWKGALQGLANNKVMAQKKAYERLFNEMAVKDKDDTSTKLLLPRMAAAANGNKNALYASEYIREAVYGVEIVRQAAVLQKVMELYRSGADTPSLMAGMKALQQKMDAFYKDYIPSLDKKVFEALMPVYLEQNQNVVAPGLEEQLKMSGNSYASWANMVVMGSILSKPIAVDELLGRIQPKDTFDILKDPAYRLFLAVHNFEQQKIRPSMKSYQSIMKPLHRTFIAKQMQYPHAPHALYPDANQTLRVAFGTVEPLQLENSNSWQTNLDDLIARHDASVAELTIPERLRKLYLSRNYGQWSENGKMPVNFLTTSQTTGGNSGSPVLNAKGQLIGLNFDRPWQGTMSDFYYSDKECRNISVDIRYVMFLIEQYGNAGWLLQEMEFVE